MVRTAHARTGKAWLPACAHTAARPGLRSPILSTPTWPRVRTQRPLLARRRWYNGGVEPLSYCDDLPLPAKDEILRRLAGRAGRESQLEVLRLLCPCRNTFRDADVWRAVKNLWQTHHVRDVRGGAHHALISLRERARMDSQTAALILAIGVGPEQRRHGWLWTDGWVERPTPVRNDVPTLIELLAGGDPVERNDALLSLFPRDGRHVARAVWREFERAAKSTEPRLRERARRALRVIEERQLAVA